MEGWVTYRKKISQLWSHRENLLRRWLVYCLDRRGGQSIQGIILSMLMSFRSRSMRGKGSDLIIRINRRSKRQRVIFLKYWRYLVLHRRYDGSWLMLLLYNLMINENEMRKSRKDGCDVLDVLPDCLAKGTR